MKKFCASLMILTVLLISSLNILAQVQSANFGEATQRAKATLTTYAATSGAKATTTPVVSTVDDVSTRVRVNKNAWVYGSTEASATVPITQVPVSAESYHYCGAYSYYFSAYFVDA